MSRVFVLGAGFSSCCGIPTTEHLFNEIMAFDDDAGQEKADILYYIQYLYPAFRAMPGEYPNIEDFLSICDASEEFGKVLAYDWIDEELWARIRDEVTFLLCDYLWDRMEKVKEANPVANFVDQLEPGDVIVTFNWDVLLEKMLSVRQRQMTYGAGRDGKVGVLKLHGSIDWLRLRGGVEPKHSEKFQRLGHDLWRVKGFKNPSPSGILERPPFIVPPTVFKKYEQGNLRRHWSEAFYALWNATEINIIGYSLPPADLLARTLLRQAVCLNRLWVQKDKLKISVVNTDATTEGTYLRHVDESIRFLPVKFEDSEFAGPHQ